MIETSTGERADGRTGGFKFPPVRMPARLSVMLFVLLACVTGVLYAHAALLRTEPAANAIIDRAPARVRLWFSEPIDAPPDAVLVFDPAGVRVDGRDGRVAPDDGSALQASVHAMARGTYTVRWRIVSEDGHPISGSFQFSVGEMTGGMAPAEAAGAAIPLLATARAVHLAGLAFLLGGLALLLLMPAELEATRAAQLARRALRIGAVVLVLGAPLMLFAQSRGVGSVSGALEGRWGLLFYARLALSLVLLGLCFVKGRTALFATAAVAVLLLVPTSMNGHAGATAPVALSVTLDALHLGSTAVWLGGLFVMAFVLRRAGPEHDPLVHRFSNLALACVQILLITGFYATWAHVDAPASLTSTEYGKALLFKLALFALMLAPAAFNLLSLRRRSAEPDRARALRRSIAAEAAIGAVVLVIAARLSAMEPARAPGLQAVAPAMAMEMHETMQAQSSPARIELVQQVQGHTVTLAIDPAQPGSNHVVVEARDAAGYLANVLGVEVRTAGTAGGPSALTRLARDASGAFAGTLSLTGAPAELQVSISLADGGTLAARFGVAPAHEHMEHTEHIEHAEHMEHGVSADPESE